MVKISFVAKSSCLCLVPLGVLPAEISLKKFKPFKIQTPDQIQVIELLIENEDYGGGVVETTDQMTWATDFGMTTIPVLDADSTSGVSVLTEMVQIPSTVMIGPDMKLSM